MNVTSSRGILRTIGFAFAVAGLPPLAIALGWLPAEELPVPLWIMGCGGATLAFAGLALLIPEASLRTRGLLTALSMTALATLFDWIAFGHFQGGWRLMLETLVDSLALRQKAVHNIVVLFAVLLTLLAMFGWSQWTRSLTHRHGTPLKRPGRKKTGRIRPPHESSVE